jgi:ribosomal-protein-alanine N-acetyltransferase
VETVLNEAVKASVQKVFLEVRSSNTAAIKLYEGQGFKKQGIRKKYYSDNNEDAIVYAIELRSIPLRSVAS